MKWFELQTDKILWYICKIKQSQEKFKLIPLITVEIPSINFVNKYNFSTVHDVPFQIRFTFHFHSDIL